MTEEEMYDKDLQTIYELIDIHAKMNKVETDKEQQEHEQYIDNINF